MYCILKKQFFSFKNLIWLAFLLQSIGAQKDSFGLIKTYDILPNFFPQAPFRIKKEYSIKNSFKTISIYEDFSTLAIFDVLPIYGKLKNYYDDLQKASSSFFNKQGNTLKKTLPSENFTVFVFADIKINNSLNLDHKGCDWKVCLEKGQTKILPKSIAFIREEPYIKRILEHRFDRLKKMYRLDFSLSSDFLSTPQKIKITFVHQDTSVSIDLNDVLNSS